MMRTLIPGTLTILSAYPDPPFDVMKDGGATGFDVELMRAVCGRLSLELRPLSYQGENFNDIFAGLAQGTSDAVISGTTITPERAAVVRFSRPYLQFNQGIAVNRRLTPHVSSTADLRGLTAGIQKGNTSDIVARQLLAQGDIAAISYYPYDGIGRALDDLEAGRIGLVIKLFPVISWLTRERQEFAVAMQIPTQERLGIAYAPERADSAMPSMPPLRHCARAASSQSCRPPGRALARPRRGDAMHAFKLYTSKDNGSHVLEGTLTMDRRTDVAAVHFKESPPHSSFDWHDAPESQYVITLAGTLEFTTRDGETFIIHPGDVLVATETVGSGHKWRLIDDAPWRRCYVVLKPGAADLFA